jgi:hypothetical protein
VLRNYESGGLRKDGESPVLYPQFSKLGTPMVVDHACAIGIFPTKNFSTTKGLELPAYDVRGAKAHGLNFATSYTGADHNRGYAFQEIFGIPVPYAVDRFSAEGKGKLTK